MNTRSGTRPGQTNAQLHHTQTLHSFRVVSNSAIQPSSHTATPSQWPGAATLLFAALWLISACARSPEPFAEQQPDMMLWYEQPATEWVQALPVGNGRLGAMVFGRPLNERIQLNEESLWAGSPMNNNNPAALEHLPRLRELLFADRVDEAQAMVAEHFLGTPPRIRSYQTAGDLYIRVDEHSPISDYRRALHLETGIATVEYQAGDVGFKREVFASAPDNVVVVHLSASKPGALNLDIALERSRDANTTAHNEHTLLMQGQIIDEPDELRGPGGAHMRFAAAVRAVPTGGQIYAHHDPETGGTEPGAPGADSPPAEVLRVRGADALTLYYTAFTNYDADRLDFFPEDHADSDVAARSLHLVDQLGSTPYQQVRERHMHDHAALFNRVKLDLGGAEQVATPVDQRLEAMRQGAEDPHLVTTLFHYGRYLLMGSSREPGVLPANLQGVWNHHYDAPWNSDFHLNINLQMNYWPAEITNLPETKAPLVRFMNRLTVPGSVTAHEMYGAGGWTLHHLTDPFGRSGVMDGPWGLTPMCGPWMTFPLWRHYAYSLDRDYLRRDLWPVLSESARFVLDFLVESPEGELVTNPSHSPENVYRFPDSDTRHTLTYGATMDIQIAREVLESTIEASLALNTDAELRRACERALALLPPTRIGADGTIMEWIRDFEEPDPGHRHISHMLGLYPLHHISADTPELLQAAEQTIERRLRFGGGHTGWSRAWIISFYNRLYNSEKAYENLMLAIRQATLENLFSTHPPFQIDGNFGNTAAIAGMFLNSSSKSIELLPALPEAWPDGSISGLRARGGFTVSMRWEDGQLAEAIITSSKRSSTVVRYNGVELAQWDAVPGQERRFVP